MIDYGSSFDEKLLLGHIAWYSVSTVQGVTADRLYDLADEWGLSPEGLPSEPRPDDAFKRACRYGHWNNVPIPGSLNKANFLIRDVSQNKSWIERHLVMEIVDPEQVQLFYEVVARLRWDRVEHKLDTTLTPQAAAHQGLVDAALVRFHTIHSQTEHTVDPQVIRLAIRWYLKDMGAINVRERGGIYFVPIRSREKMAALEGVVNGLGGTSGFHSLPLVDDTKQRDMVRSAFEQDVHDSAQSTLVALLDRKQSGGKVSAKQWAKWNDELAVLEESRNFYRDLLDDELAAADFEIDAIRQTLTAFLEGEDDE